MTNLNKDSIRDKDTVADTDLYSGAHESPLKFGKGHLQLNETSRLGDTSMKIAESPPKERMTFGIGGIHYL